MIIKQVRILQEIRSNKNEDFEVVEVEIPELQDGQVLVENKYPSTDPSVRSQWSIDPVMFLILFRESYKAMVLAQLYKVKMINPSWYKFIT